MRAKNAGETPKLRAVRLSQVRALEEAGYVRFEGGDAGRANSDFFQIMIKSNTDGTWDVRILCPSFLRGPLGFGSVKRSISY